MTDTIETDKLTDYVILTVQDWYEENVHGDGDTSLMTALQAVGEVKVVYGDNILYDRVWIHPAFRDQPENDDPPGSILHYWFCHVYQINPKYRDASYKPALVRVIIGKIGNTTMFEIRHPGETEA